MARAAVLISMTEIIDQRSVAAQLEIHFDIEAILHR